MAKKVKLFAEFRSKFDLMMRQRVLNGAKALIKVVCLDESYEQIGLRGLLTQNLPKEYEEAITRQYLNKMERMLQIDEAACMAEFKYAPKPHENIRAVYDETTGKMFDQLSIGVTSWLTPQDSSKVMAATINWDHLIYFWLCSYLIGIQYATTHPMEVHAWLTSTAGVFIKTSLFWFRQVIKSSPLTRESKEFQILKSKATRSSELR